MHDSVFVCVWRCELVVDAKHFRGESTELVSEQADKANILVLSVFTELMLML